MTLRQTDVEHIHKLVYGDLNVCGCGDPLDALLVIYHILITVPTLSEVQAGALNRIDELFSDTMDGRGARQLLHGLLAHAGLIEHGGLLASSWLTPKGEYYRVVIGPLPNWAMVDEVGLPHGGDPCADACWRLTDELRRIAPLPPRPSPYVNPNSQFTGALTPGMIEMALGPGIRVPDTIPDEWVTRVDRPSEDRLPRGRNPYIGCREVGGTWIHGRPHSCPVWARGF